ncbi:MAG TPA: TonB-dependent receptor [Bryobacteraceae bacterium]|nr:TonB-dependent receptor [Bryobacteraceae bacterium]
MLQAQVPSGGTLSGRITNATGSGIPNAAVTVTNVSTNSNQRVLTAPDGTFSVVDLQPGTYRVDVETEGFKRTSQENVQLTAAGPATVNLTLEAGSLNESVEIKGTSPATQDDNAEVSVGLGMRPVQELPVIDRNHQQLSGLQTGITPPTPALSNGLDPERNRFYSTDGQAPFLNQYYQGGLINQEPNRGTAIRVVPEEGIEQMNIVTASPTMEKGFTGGAFVNDMVRSGSNGFHGSLYEFWSGNLLRARNAFDTVDTGSPRYNFNQFGATAGGAGVPDKTFLFGSYEGTFNRGDQTSISTVPVPAAIGGNFSSIPGLTLYSPFAGTAAGAGRSTFGGGIIPAGSINPTSAAIAALLPAPNRPGFADNLVSNTPFRNDHQKVDGRVDQHFTDRTNAFLRFGFSNDHALTESPLGLAIGAGTRDRLLGYNAALGVTHELSSGLLTQLQLGYNRYDQKLGILGDQALSGTPALSGFTNGIPNINISGLPAIGAPGYLPEHPIDNTFNWDWAWGLHTARHNLKWGLDVRRIRSDGFLDTAFGNVFGPNGTLYFGPGATLLNNGAPLSQYAELYNSFAAFLLNAPSQTGVANYAVPPSVRESQYGLWIGDTIQVLHKVTLDLGLRYELYSPLEPRIRGGAAVFNSSTDTFNFAGIGNTPMHAYMYDLDNLAPRIGLAFHATPKTVVRAGYSMQYFEMPYLMSGMMAPLFGSVQGVQGGYTVAPSLSPLPASPALANGTAAGNLPAAIIPHTLQTPYLQTFNLQIQQDFYYGTVLSLGYVGALGRHLQGIEELNAALPGTGVAGLPFSNIGRTGSTLLYNDGLTSNYNSLQVSLVKRFSQGISFLGSYTFAKALGYTTASGMLLDPANLRADYGPQDYDRQHVLSISHLWELPFGRKGNGLMSTILGGWQLNGIFTWATGTPLTLTADPLLCACPGNTVLASAGGPVSTTGNYNGQTFISGSFFAPVGATTGNLTRGAIRGPGFKNYDMSLFKNFRVRDRFNLQVRGEAYNLTNSPRLANPVTNINSPDFGQVTSTVNGAFGRQVDLAARLQF